MTIEQYARMHEDGHFAGHSTEKWSSDIKSLISLHQANTLLDYGSGKGMQYYKQRLHADWGIEMPVLYDPAVPSLSDKDRLGREYDGVICTDVLEHLEGHDLIKAIRECMAPARKFVLFTITCRPAKKNLPDGRNCHITIEPPMWWRGFVQACVESHFGIPTLDVQLRFEE